MLAGVPAVTDVPAVVGVPAVAGVPAMADVHIIAGVAVVAGVPSVNGVPDNASFTTVAGVLGHICSKTDHIRILDCRAINTGLAVISSIYYSEYRILDSRIRETNRLAIIIVGNQSIRLLAIGLSKNYRLPSSIVYTF